MKKGVLIFLLFFASSVIWGMGNLFATACECGTHATGIYSYNTLEPTGGCCTGSAGSTAWLFEYEPGEGDTWILVAQTKISGSAAQQACCPVV